MIYCKNVASAHESFVSVSALSAALQTLQDQRTYWPKFSAAIVQVLKEKDLLSILPEKKAIAMRSFNRDTECRYGDLLGNPQKIKNLEKAIARYWRNAEIPLWGRFFRRRDLMVTVSARENALECCRTYQENKAELATYKTILIVSDSGECVDRFQGRINWRGEKIAGFLKLKLALAGATAPAENVIAEWADARAILYRLFSAKALTLENIVNAKQKPEYLFNRIVLDIVADRYTAEDLRTIGSALDKNGVNTQENQCLVASIVNGPGAQEKYQLLKDYLSRFSFKSTKHQLQLISHILNIPKPTLDEKISAYDDNQRFFSSLSLTKEEKQILAALFVQQPKKMADYDTLFRKATMIQRCGSKDQELALLILFFSTASIDQAEKNYKGLEDIQKQIATLAVKKELPVSRKTILAALASVITDRSQEFIQSYFVHYRKLVSAGYSADSAEYVSLLMTIKLWSELLKESSPWPDALLPLILNALRVVAPKTEKRTVSQKQVLKAFGFIEENDEYVYW